MIGGTRLLCDNIVYEDKLLVLPWLRVKLSSKVNDGRVVDTISISYHEDIIIAIRINETVVEVRPQSIIYPESRPIVGQRRFVLQEFTIDKVILPPPP